MTTRKIEMRICDRCQLEVEVHYDPNGKEFPNDDWMKLRTDQSSDRYRNKFFGITHTEVADLCPECVDGFSRWWSLNK